MTDLPKIVRERMRTVVVGDHPDPDLLTAFAEQALPERERMPLMDHLARCADCRDVLALAAVSAGAVATQTKDTAVARKAPWFSFPMLRWGALAACLVIVSTAVLLRRDPKSSYVAKDERQEAGLRPPAAASVDRAQAENATANRPTETKTKSLADVQVPAAAPSYVAAAPRASREKSLTTDIPASGARVGAVLGQPVAPAASGPSPVLANDLRDERQGDAGRGAFALAGSNGSAAALPAPAPVPPAPTNKNVPAPHLAANAAQTSEPLAQMVDAVPAESDKSDKKVEVPGRAKTAAVPASAALAVAPNDEFEMQKSIAPALEASRARKDLARSVHPESLRWNISSVGQLVRSTDSGKSWQPVTVAEGATFRHLTYNGPDIWVGGAAGSLYHSPDAGGHWIQVKPVANAVSLTADIAAIAFTDPQHGKITTTNGQTWSTSDGGQSWMQQP
jgi:hypothetical protein